jgi:hypothetical protein
MNFNRRSPEQAPIRTPTQDDYWQRSDDYIAPDSPRFVPRPEHQRSDIELRPNEPINPFTGWAQTHVEGPEFELETNGRHVETDVYGIPLDYHPLDY